MVKRMQTASNARTARRWVFLLAAASGAVVTALWLWHTIVEGIRLWTSGTPTSPDEVLLPLVASGALVAILWLSCGIVLEVLAGMPGTIGGWAEHAATVLTPRQVRAVIAAMLGIGITAGLATGASAVGSAPLPLTAPSPVPAHTPHPGISSLPDPGWVPTAPTVRPQPDVRVLSPVPRDDSAERDSPHEVVVHRGDSLWAIAARHLGPAASDAEIADAWPDWYAANRHVIGSDPDLLLPGQVLRAPERVGS
jgi:LysM domain